MPVPIRFQGIVGTTAEIATDRFAGRIALDTTLARFVVFFDATNYATMARRDVLETFAAGIQDSTLGVGLPMYATTAGRHATESVSAFRTRIGAQASATAVVTNPTGLQVIVGQALLMERAVATQDAYLTRVTGEAVSRFRIAANGLHDWGDGTNPRDTNLYRSAANVLKTDDAFDASEIRTSGTLRISSGGAGALTTLSTTGLATLASATINGALSKVISSTTETVSGNIFSQYTTVTQTGIVTNQSLAGTGAGSRTIGAGRLNTQGAGMDVYLCGTYTTDGSAGNATIRIRFGSTTFRTIGSFALDNNVTDGVWYIRGRITTRTTGATGTIGGQLMWEHQASSVVGSQVMHIETATSSADVTLDLTASQVFDVDWTATDAGTSITCTCFSINLIR